MSLEDGLYEGGQLDVPGAEAGAVVGGQGDLHLHWECTGQTRCAVMVRYFWVFRFFGVFRHCAFFCTYV